MKHASLIKVCQSSHFVCRSVTSCQDGPRWPLPFVWAITWCLCSSSWRLRRLEDSHPFPGVLRALTRRLQGPSAVETPQALRAALPRPHLMIATPTALKAPPLLRPHLMITTPTALKAPPLLFTHSLFATPTALKAPPLLRPALR